MASDIPSSTTACPSGYDDPWKLRLFFSVDLIGSTAYKAYSKNALNDWEWCWTFEEFYSNFPAIFEQSKLEVEEWAICENDSLAVPWKFLGDEILFQSVLSDYRETLFQLRTLQLALQKYNKKLQNKFRESKGNVVLQCKGTAWLAGFPISNVEIKTPADIQVETSAAMVFDCKCDSEKYGDFIGSQMDCGFRLTKYASTRKLILSIDLAIMLAEAMLDVPSGSSKNLKNKMGIRFEGKESLKGVLAGKPYPIFWLDQESESQNSEDRWLGLGENCEPENVVVYCESFLESTEGIHRPFINQDKGGKFIEKPEGFEERRAKAIDERIKLRIAGKQADDDGTSIEESIQEGSVNTLKSPEIKG